MLKIIYFSGLIFAALLLAACSSDNKTAADIDSYLPDEIAETDTIKADNTEADNIESDIIEADTAAVNDSADDFMPDADNAAFCEELSAIVSPYINTAGAADKAVGMIVRVESPNLSQTCTFGSKEKGAEVKPSGNELWVIGSVSKMITSFILASKAFEGSLSMEGEIASYLPAQWNIPAGPSGEKLTVKQLLTHTSELPHYPATLQTDLNSAAGLDDMYAAWEDYTLDDLTNDLAVTKITAVPGTVYGYSDFGFALAQQIAENVYAVPYPQIVKGFADKMGLHNTTVPEELSDAQKANLFYGHAGPAIVPAKRPAITPVFTGDGFIYSDADDLGRLLRLFSGIDQFPDNTSGGALILATQKLFHRDVSGVPVDQGLGLGIITSGGYTLYKKNGTSIGTTTVFLWDPANHIGIAAAGNIIPFSDGINNSACQIFAAAAARSGLQVATEVTADCQVPF